MARRDSRNDEPPDTRMRRTLHAMIRDGQARRVVQAYLRAMRAGENAEQTAVALIARLQPRLTLAEPAEMLERLLGWIAAEHGDWWRKALLRPPPLHRLNVRELYRRGWVIQARCTRHREPTITYSIPRLEFVLGAADPPVHAALARLHCPKCYMRVDSATVVRSQAALYRMTRAGRAG